MKRFALFAAALAMSAAIHALPSANAQRPSEWTTFTIDEVRMHCGAYSYGLGRTMLTSPGYSATQVMGALLYYYVWTDGYGNSAIPLVEKAFVDVHNASVEQGRSQLSFCLHQGVELLESLDNPTKQRLVLKAQAEYQKLAAQLESRRRQQ